MNCLKCILLIFIVQILVCNYSYSAENYTVAAYYFPGWHFDSKDKISPTGGLFRWEQLKAATPKFTGHQQPKIPLWGYEDEANPSTMEKKINYAVKYGVNTFIFDWYYNNAGPYLNGPLDNAFLAANNNKMKFAIMWANHPVNGISAIVNDNTYETMTTLIVEKYFKNKSYLKIDNKPYFSIFDIEMFINNFGGIEGAVNAINILRQKTKKAGFDGIYLSIVEWKLKSYADIYVNTLLQKLKADCVDSYVWTHRSHMNNFPDTLYDDVMVSAINNWYKSKLSYNVPFYPNVTMGWDPSPRAKQDIKNRWKQGAYPYTPVLVGNTPDKFLKALSEAKIFLDKSGYKNKILTINAWNEWTEGSYLEPDIHNNYKYLEAIKKIYQ